MEFLPSYDHAKLLQFAAKVKKDINAWQFVAVSLTGKTTHNAPHIAWKLREYFRGIDGVIFVCAGREILALVNMGPQTDPDGLCSDIEKTMPQYSCSVEAMPAAMGGLPRLQLRLQDAMKEKSDTPPLLTARMERARDIVMVVEDDMFVRSLIARVFHPKIHVVEVGGIDGLVETYLSMLPDILFLDIHLPGGSGMEALSEILSFDPSAYVIIISSDSVKDNVLTAKNLGAKGFVAKNFSPEKLEYYYTNCPTVMHRKAAHEQR